MNSINSAAHATVLKHTGAGLVVFGALDFVAMIYCISNGISYSSSFNIFAIVAGILLMRGSLRTASIVRWMSVFLLVGLSAFVLALPFIQPWDLTLTQASQSPWQSAAAFVVMLSVLGLLYWVQRNLGTHPVRAAITSSGRRLGDMRLPMTLGIGLVMLLVVFVPLFLGGANGMRAASMAKAQLGNDFQYHVSSLQVTSTSEGTFVSAVVTAWNQREIRKIPVSWSE